jgi:hypothetical protein
MLITTIIYIERTEKTRADIALVPANLSLLQKILPRQQLPQSKQTAKMLLLLQGKVDPFKDMVQNKLM